MDCLSSKAPAKSSAYLHDRDWCKRIGVKGGDLQVLLERGKRLSDRCRHSCKGLIRGDAD
jgi:hypothetical protein